MRNNYPVYIGLCNPKSPTNVGAVLRAAGCYQAAAVVYTGERYDRAVKYQTDTQSIKNKIPLQHDNELLHDLPAGMQVVCIELVEGAKPLTTFQHPQSAIYIFGPEDGSISQQIINRADEVVYVPTVGCMNLAASVNVVLYDRLAKSNVEIDHESMIKQNRDANNRLVKDNG